MKSDVPDKLVWPDFFLFLVDGFFEEIASLSTLGNCLKGNLNKGERFLFPQAKKK